jgi:glycosyltransferase involved in cell wall biosynthesis
MWSRRYDLRPVGNLAATEKPADAARHRAADAPELELTVVLPCLNEAETVAGCVAKAGKWLHDAGVSGEVIVADNGSTDASAELARAAGAHVVPVRRKGYGNALIGGIRAARSPYVLMADADDSYDLEHLGPFLERLRAGDDLVMGNRFAGGIEPGAMPWLHRRIGNPLLSRIGRLLYRTPVRDFHCGIRAFRKEAIVELGLHGGGMEFASEMIVKASLANLRISEVPTTLQPDGRSRAPHLRSFRDGWRHLRFLLLFCPKWLFIVPGLMLFALGVAGTAVLTFTHAGGLDIAGLMYAASLTIIGYQALWFGLLMQTYAESRGILPEARRMRRVRRALTLERGLIIGVGLLLIGTLVAIISILRWRSVHFGPLDSAQNVRLITPAILGLVLGSQTVLGSFSIGVLGIRTAAPDDPQARAGARSVSQTRNT